MTFEGHFQTERGPGRHSPSLLLPHFPIDVPPGCRRSRGADISHDFHVLGKRRAAGVARGLDLVEQRSLGRETRGASQKQVLRGVSGELRPGKSESMSSSLDHQFSYSPHTPRELQA